MNDWRKRFIQWCSKPLPSKEFQLLLYDNALIAPALLCALQNHSGQLLVILPDPTELEKTAAALSCLCNLIQNEREIIPLPEVAPSRKMWIPENEAGRCAALQAALQGVPGVFLTTPSVLIASTLAPKQFKSKSFTLHKGDTISPAKLVERLVELDYDNEAEVHEPGEFSKRGGIFDIYSPLYDSPIRLEFWGDEIDSMRTFLPDTQRSIQEVQELKIVPRGTAILDTENAPTAQIRDFFPKNIQTILVNPSAIHDHINTYFDDEAQAAWKKTEACFVHPARLIISPEDSFAPSASSTALRLDAVSLGTELTHEIPELGDGAAVWHWKQLKDSITRWNSTGYSVIACCSESGELDRLKELIKNDEHPEELQLVIEQQPLVEGLLLPEAKLALLSSQELFGRKSRHRRKKLINYKHNHSLSDEIELEEGSYVVHISHGIALFHGIKTIESADELQEVLDLEFAEDVHLYVPLEEAFLVSRYMGAGKAQPKLNKIGTSSWGRAKENAEEAAWDLAADLIKVEALRQNATGHSLKPSIEWERNFANSFPYKETPDQEQAITTVLKDMEEDKPMDRLLCGDVGYGKTEVAIRAAFRAVLNGKQVAVLVPTTVLAQQHYQTFRERMAEYPVTIDVISRFRTAKEQNEILRKAATGEIDILIGTHRIIQKDVKFRALGLLIIDEEQRFGVQHKQMLKGMRADLDILTMTATPIPRTLYFSLSGIRNLSTIMTAPVDRLPVTTIVANYDTTLIKLAIQRELERRGQVFFLYNRVKTIDKMKECIEQMLPEARCAIAHGQMRPAELEKIMTQFVKHEFDVLICTTIIESGMDIPNVNTILIDRADRFGLSELYQLRGRVGRHHRQAYAYMLLPPMGSLAQNARERLAAIRRYTHLGAGFKLAMRDLEIRGAGNILGTEQSGHIAAVGFELYCQLLKDAVNSLVQHQKAKPPAQCQVNLDRVTFALKSMSGKTPVGFPKEYIQELSLRIDCYKKINLLQTTEELEDYKKELKDRFGPLPDPVEELFLYHHLKRAATARHIISINFLNGRILIETPQGLYRNQARTLPTSTAADGHAQMLEALKIVESM